MVFQSMNYHRKAGLLLYYASLQAAKLSAKMQDYYEVSYIIYIYTSFYSLHDSGERVRCIAVWNGCIAVGKGLSGESVKCIAELFCNVEREFVEIDAQISSFTFMCFMCVCVCVLLKLSVCFSISCVGVCVSHLLPTLCCLSVCLCVCVTHTVSSDCLSFVLDCGLFV